MSKEECGRYTAYYLMGGIHANILSVLAASPEKAEERIKEELSKAGRHRYLQLWERDGKLVKLNPLKGEGT